MSNIEQPKKTISFDPERCNSIYVELIEVFQKHKPTVGEILVAFGNLGYSLGASIGGFGSKGPAVEELNKLYYSEPGRLDVALMIQSLQVLEWYESYEQQQIKG